MFDLPTARVASELSSERLNGLLDGSKLSPRSRVERANPPSRKSSRIYSERDRHASKDLVPGALTPGRNQGTKEVDHHPSERGSAGRYVGAHVGMFTA